MRAAHYLTSYATCELIPQMKAIAVLPNCGHYQSGNSVFVGVIFINKNIKTFKNNFMLNVR